MQPPPRPEPARVPPVRWTDPPGGTGDALSRLASMRLTPEMTNETACRLAAAPAQPNRKARRARRRIAA